MTGAFKPNSPQFTTSDYRGSTSGWVWLPLDFYASRVVPTASENQVRSLGIVIWRRLPEPI